DLVGADPERARLVTTDFCPTRSEADLTELLVLTGCPLFGDIELGRLRLVLLGLGGLLGFFQRARWVLPCRLFRGRRAGSGGAGRSLGCCRRRDEEHCQNSRVHAHRGTFGKYSLPWG